MFSYNKSPKHTPNNSGGDNDDFTDSDDDKSPSDETKDNDEEYVMQDLYVDAPINNRSLCNRKYAFDLITDKRSYWLNCNDINELSEWIIQLKYAIFGKRVIDGYLTKKSRKKLKIKWKKRYIEVYESKIIRVYKNDKKTKVKEQIDLDPMNVSYIKYGDDQDGHPFIIEIYDNNCNLSHVFSAENKTLRDEFMDSFYVTMQAQKIDVMCEGYLHFRADEVKCWKYAYFALIQGSLIQFRDTEGGNKACFHFRNTIFSNDDYYNDAFKKYVHKSMPMIDPQVEKRELHEIDTTKDYKYSAPEYLLKSLKIFLIKTTIGKWYFGAEEATEFLLWCQSFHKYLNRSSSSIKRPSAFTNRNDEMVTETTKIQKLFSTSDDEEAEVNIDDRAKSAEPQMRNNGNVVQNGKLDIIVANEVNDNKIQQHKQRTDVTEEIFVDHSDHAMFGDLIQVERKRRNKQRKPSALNSKVVMGVDLNKTRSHTIMRGIGAQSQPIRAHFLGSQSVQFTGMTGKEFLAKMMLSPSETDECDDDLYGKIVGIDEVNKDPLDDMDDMDDMDTSHNVSKELNDKKEVDSSDDEHNDDMIEETEYRHYATESEGESESDKDCLEPTMTEDDHLKADTLTMTNFILNDD